MHTAKGFIQEIYGGDRRAARITCPPALVPAPGQYLMATAASDPDAPLAQPLFSAGPCPGGFFAAPELPSHWLPGSELNLRGPLGHGFNLPGSARQVALAAVGGSCARVLALLEPALAQKTSVVLLSDHPPLDLPAVLEILPLSALPEITPWADYLAIDLPRAHLPEMLEILIHDHRSKPSQGKIIAPRAGCVQLLLATPFPCAGLAECGVCAVEIRPGSGYKLACQDGPVFDLY